MADETLWVCDVAGNKACVSAADRDRWTVHGWSETVPPVDGEFVWMAKDDVTHPGLIPWAARDYWQGIGFEPAAPPEPVNPTRDPALTAAPASAAAVPDGTAANDSGRRSRRAGQSEHTSAAPAAPKMEE